MAANPKPKAPKTTPSKPAKAKRGTDGASTSPIVLNSNEARYIGDQLRGIAYLAKKLALAIREKNSRTPFDPKEIEDISNASYALAGRLKGHGDDGSNGG